MSRQLPLYQGGRRGLRQSPTGLRCEHNSSENTADATDTKYKVLKTENNSEKYKLNCRCEDTSIKVKITLVHHYREKKTKMQDSGVTVMFFFSQSETQLM